MHHNCTPLFANKAKKILVLTKDLGTQMVKWALEYLLESHDPAHMVHLSSGIKAVG